MRARRLVLVLGAALLAATPPGIRAQDLEQATGYIEMPPSTDGSYTLSSGPGSGRHWGRPEFVRFLVAVAREWKKRHPDLPRLHIGDMSKPDGADFPPHKTHKDGLTADLFTKPKNICHVDYENQQLTLELAELIHAMGARQILYNGDLVVSKVKVAQKWEKHDDHFHVVIDPSKVPDDTKPVFLPAGSLANGATVGGSAFEREKDGKRVLLLRWNALGGESSEKARSITATLDDLDDANGVLFTAKEKPGKEPVIRAAVELEDGKKYRWKLEVELTSGEVVGFDWQTFTAELTQPEVELQLPPEGVVLSGVPELSWSFAKKGAEQASFVVELSDQGPKKPTLRIGPIAGKEGKLALRATALRRNQRWHWRVRVRDKFGNEAVSEWRSFKSSFDWKFAPPQAKTARACELRDASGSKVVARLKKGEAVLVLAETEDKLAVRRGTSEGFVLRADIDLD